MQSALYEAGHEAFRAMVRDFLAKEVVPHHAAWEEAGMVDRSVWLKAGEQGLLGMDVSEEFGGGGVKDFRYNAVLAAEISRVGASGLGFTLHNDVVAPYLTGWLNDTTGNQRTGLWFVGVAMLAAAVGALLLARSATRTENRRVADEVADEVADATRRAA